MSALRSYPHINEAEVCVDEQNAAEAIAHIMVQKFVMGSPLYRQELERMGIPLSRQTMSKWILRASEEYLAPIWERLHEEMLKREVLHADETTLQALHENGKAAQSKSYLRLYHTSGNTDKKPKCRYAFAVECPAGVQSNMIYSQWLTPIGASHYFCKEKTTGSAGGSKKL